MVDAAALAGVTQRYAALSPHLDERKRRLMVAAETVALGPGSLAAVSRATGIARTTIMRGIKELDRPVEIAEERVRRPGAGRKRAVDKDPTLRSDLERLVEPGSRGDPESPLRWTCKSTRKLAAQLTEMGHQIGPSLARRLLHEMGYSLQANRKVLEGSSHPDRNAQFEHINATSTEHLAAGEPVISVDTKKKELVGAFKNGGKEFRPKGDPEPVLVHDFVTELGRVNPYGVYDVGQNAGWVSVGIDHDTAAFAVESIRRWWTTMGAAAYPNATRLLITADGGGSNGYRVRLWKFELQRLANETGLELTVCHLPPGTSKWNKIEHRLFSFISQNWRGKPLISYQVIVELIAATTTTKGLTVRSALDENTYEKGRTVSDADMATVNVTPDTFHGEWNYTIRPRPSP
jgi:transposase